MTQGRITPGRRILYECTDRWLRSRALARAIPESDTPTPSRLNCTSNVRVVSVEFTHHRPENQSSRMRSTSRSGGASWIARISRRARTRPELGWRFDGKGDHGDEHALLARGADHLRGTPSQPRRVGRDV